MVQTSNYGEFVILIVTLSVLWVAIHICIGFIGKLFWKMFLENPIFVATNAFWIQFSTRTMQHIFNHFLVQLGTIMVQFCTDKFIQVFWMHHISH